MILWGGRYFAAPFLWRQSTAAIMSVIKQHLKAEILKSGERAALLLNESAELLYVSYALVEKETEVEILPESLLDDWGHEITSLELYEWIHENGIHFPRAELFGFDISGTRRQCFLRELDLVARYPCYCFESLEDPPSKGVRIETILLPDRQISNPEPMRRPAKIGRPMELAQVSWWRVPNSEPYSFDSIFVK